MANLKDVIYLSNEDYETLVSTGTVTISGTTLTYDANTVYITPETLASTTEDGLMSASDKSKLDGIASGAQPGTVTSVRVQAGTGLSSSTSTAQTSTLDTTISIASGYKLPTTTEWGNKQDALPTTTTAGKVLKSTSTAGTVEWGDDTNTNTWRNVKVDNTEKLGTGTGTGALNFVSQNTNNGDVTFTYDGGIKATAKVPTVNDGTLSIQGNGTTASTFTANQSGNTTLNIKGSGGTTVSKSADNEITVSSPSVSLTTTAGSEKITVGSSSLNLVTRNTTQTIGGNKTFLNDGGSNKFVIELDGVSDVIHAKTTTNNQHLYITLDNGGGNGSGIRYNDCSDGYPQYEILFPLKSGRMATLSDVPTNYVKKYNSFDDFICLTPQGGGSINKFYIGTESTPKFAATGSPGINIYGLYSSSLSDTHVNIFYDDDTGGQSTIATCLGNNTTYYARFPLVTGTVALDATVPNFQATTSVVGNAVTNVNGRVFQNYTATLVTAGGYTFYQILKNGSNPTESEAKEYMRYMTGSTFLPTYNYDFPKQTTFIFADSSMWKPQYSENDGLRLYRLSTGYVNLDGAQTISGAKTFSTSPILNNGVYLKGKNSSSTQYGLIGISSANNVVINPDSVSDTIIYGNRFRPGSGATPDLGSSSNKWKDIYLSGSLSDGTNSISVANIVAKQNALPTTTTAGQVLKSTSTSGTVEWGSVTDNDHYPTTFTWTDGTTAGPTGSLTGNSGFSAVSFGAIPSATASVSGIVTTDEQTFAGKKIFKNGIQIGNSVPNTATLQANNASLRFSGNVSSFTPSQTNSMSLGASITGTLYTWKNLFLSGFLSKDNSSYGLELPSSSGWTANKTIATTDQIPTVSYPVTDVQIGGTSILSGTVANIVTNSTYNASTNKIATMSDLPQIVDLRS